MSGANVSQIENGNTGYTQATLEAFAAALQCEVVDLLIRDPTDPDGIWSLWDRAKDAERQQIVEIAKTVLRFRA